MGEYTYDLSSAFLSGSGTIVLPGGGRVTIGGGTGYPGSGGVAYPYYGYPGTSIGTTVSGWMPLILIILVFLGIVLLAR